MGACAGFVFLRHDFSLALRQSRIHKASRNVFEALVKQCSPRRLLIFIVQDSRYETIAGDTIRIRCHDSEGSAIPSHTPASKATMTCVRGTALRYNRERSRSLANGSTNLSGTNRRYSSVDFKRAWPM